MNDSLISVIVPVYDVEKYLRECIESILAQTYRNIEVILVDDGSTDSSGTICDEYASTDTRVKVIHKPNGGLSDARNAGIEVASGVYLGFVDSDDWIEPDMYECLLSRITAGNHDIAVCGLIREYRNYSEEKMLISACYDRNTATRLLLEGIVLHDHTWSKLYRRELFKELRFPIGRYYEDVLTTYKTFLQAESIVIEPKALYHYRQRDGSLIKGGFTERRFELLRAVETLSCDDRIARWDGYIRARILRVKYTLLYELATYGDKKSISRYYPIIDTYLNDIKRAKSILSNTRVTKPLRAILSFSFIPNRLLFLAIWIRGRFKRLISTF